MIAVAVLEAVLLFGGLAGIAVPAPLTTSVGLFGIDLIIVFFAQFAQRKQESRGEGGKEAFGALMGLTMKKVRGKADAELVARVLKKKLRLHLDLAVERHYSVCVLSKAKKDYFGILSDGTPNLKGLTAIKSNAPIFIRNVFKSCVKELSHVKNAEEY